MILHEGNALLTADGTRFTKACACKGATASTGQIRWRMDWIDLERVRASTTFIPGPSCDRCGTAWFVEVRGA